MADSVAFVLHPNQPVEVAVGFGALEAAKDMPRNVSARNNKGKDVLKQRSVDSMNVTNTPDTGQYQPLRVSATKSR